MGLREEGKVGGGGGLENEMRGRMGVREEGKVGKRGWHEGGRESRRERLTWGQREVWRRGE